MICAECETFAREEGLSPALSEVSPREVGWAIQWWPPRLVRVHRRVVRGSFGVRRLTHRLEG